MSYDMECCYGEHEDFDILVYCVNDCGQIPGEMTVYHCGQEPPRFCRCGGAYDWEKVSR